MFSSSDSNVSDINKSSGDSMNNSSSYNINNIVSNRKISSNNMKQRIAAAAVMVPRSGRWAELDCDDGVFAGAEDGWK